MNQIDINAPFETVRRIILNPEVILRLNPSWHVRKILSDRQGFYEIALYDDSNDEKIQMSLQVVVRERGICYIMDSNMIMFSMDEIAPQVTRVSIGGDLVRSGDIPYWLKGLANYIHLEARKSRIIKRLLENFWLRMTPSQRRITIIIILAEGIGLIALIGVVIALKFLKS
jgi:hypothetical protein